MARTRARRQESYAERRERRAAIDDPQVVLEAAARYLEVRSRSVEEVRRHLRAAGYRAELVESAVTRLVELGMLDDETFARTWLESRDRVRPRGEHALRRELALKGIDRETAARALEARAEAAAEARQGESDGDGSGVEPAAAVDEMAAERLLRKRAAALARVADPRARRQRAYALLARNGFDPETCRAVSVRVLATLEQAEAGGDDVPAAEDA